MTGKVSENKNWSEIVKCFSQKISWCWSYLKAVKFRNSMSAEMTSNLVYADEGIGTEKQFYVTDSHGNVVQLTDESGKVAKIYEYDSFGNEVKPDSKDDNPFRYCGEYYDKETGEIYLRARYYQPAVGRFLTRDTYTGESDDILSLHLYTYCYNNPICYVDISGNRPIIGPALVAAIKTASIKKVKVGKQKDMGSTYYWPKDDAGREWSKRLEVCIDGKIKYEKDALKGEKNMTTYFVQQ